MKNFFVLMVILLPLSASGAGLYFVPTTPCRVAGLAFTAIQLFAPAGVFAQTQNTPAPIWSGQGKIPESYRNRKVFLSPDRHSVILVLNDQNGAEQTRILQLPLHNVIYPNLRVNIKSSSAVFVYGYTLENGTRSVDSVTTFSAVVFPDPELQTGGDLWGRAAVSTAIVGKRIGLPGAPAGGLAIWYCAEMRPLAPGSATEFTITTETRPGLTIASVEHFPHFEVSEEWPEEVIDQLNPVLDPAWIDQHLVTLGPRYSPDESAAKIAADYIIGIRELIRRNQIEHKSAFAHEAIAYLQAVSSGSSPSPLKEKPQSKIEAEVLNALQLSLHVNSGTR